MRGEGAGKGDSYRKVDRRKWAESWDRIFGKKDPKAQRKPRRKRGAMKVRATIRRGNEVRQTEWREAPENWLWYWTSGNYGCDCNRAVLFDDLNAPCNAGPVDRRYELLALETESGERVEDLSALNPDD